MANNIFSGYPNVAIARQTISFESLSFTSSNIVIIYEVGEATKSYKPGNEINPITGFTEGKGYWIVSKVNMDLEDYLIPPIPVCDDDDDTPPPTGSIEITDFEIQSFK